MWTARLLVCYLCYVCATNVNISAETQRFTVNETKSNWWDARESCRMEGGGDLYVSNIDFLIPNLHINTSYWLGAMRDKTWIWTEDGTPLYKYVGYTSLQNGTKPKSLPYNSIYECQLSCRFKSTLGLSGKKCYCLEKSLTDNSSGGMSVPCPGNPDELCDDARGMSVYTRDAGDFQFIPTRTGVCATVQNGTIRLQSYYYCMQGKRRFAFYSRGNDSTGCSGRVCLSAKTEKKTWLQADMTNDLIKLNNSTATDVQNISNATNRFWIGLTLKITTKWVDGAYEDEGYLPWVRSPTSTCLALRHSGRWMTHLVPCHLPLAFICEENITSTSVSTTTLSSTQSPSSTGDSTTESSYPSTDNQSDGHTDYPRGVIIGLSMGNAILLLTVIAVVILLQRQRKLNLNMKDRSQPMNSTENRTYDGHGLQTDNGSYSVVTPDTLDGLPFTAVPGATVNSHIDKGYVNIGTDVEEAHSAGEGYSTVEEYSAGVVQYHILEKLNSTKRGKSDVGLYKHTETAEQHYNTTRQEESLGKAEGSYSHIGAINMGFQEGDYDVANAGVVVTRFDDTYNHTSDTNTNATDS